MKKSYREKLRDPRWQKKRLEILQRDDFSCRLCYSNVHTLNVHHIEYIKGNAPWEYPDDNFLTLCEDCHKEYHAIKSDIEKQGCVLITILPLAFNRVAIYKDGDLGIMSNVYNGTGHSPSLFLGNEFIKIANKIEEIINS